MSQIFLSKHPEGTLGMRNLREMRTLTTVLDLLASNQILQAMDILAQRIKSVELFVSQGHWAQGSLLELVAAEGEQRAYSREEIKVAQAEQKVELQMQKAQWQRPCGKRTTGLHRTQWERKEKKEKKEIEHQPTPGGRRKARREKEKERKERESGKRGGHGRPYGLP